MDRSKYFDISKFLEKSCQLSWLDLIDFCNKESKRAENNLRSMKRNDPDEYTIRQYYDFVHESSYYFSQGGVPAAMRKQDFQRLKPIVEQLVARGEWRQDTLDSFL